MAHTVEQLIAKWSLSNAAERANKDAFLVELCDVLGVPRPDPTTGDGDKDSYVFEKDARFVHAGNVTTLGKIDLYKKGCFILEAKQGSSAGSKKLGTAKRGTPQWVISMQNAYGQALNYARAFDERVPFLVVCDIGYCFDLYASFDGSGVYQAFPNAQGSRLFFSDLAKHQDTLRAVFTKPLDLDPSKHAAKVTREVAGYLANLARKLEDKGHAQELVATFLMRCLFTMFAEDVGLLPEDTFTKAIRDFWLPSPQAFPAGIELLWRTMNKGGSFGFVANILKFNGGLFKNPTALPLDDHALRLLLMAAECTWGDVEPAIFGTLLERALDPKERHALGAHYTPRAYVERLVRPTIEEPLRADWEIVQVEARKHVADGKLKEAKNAVRAFHQKLCATKVLDPACGSGNFLYVTLDLFKRLESEVLALLEGLGEKQQLLHADTIRVTPKQFLGIEKKRWAKEIAELVLWIGYLQHHFRAYGNAVPPPEPVLQDYRNIECRDAVLAWDDLQFETDERGKIVTRWDGETMKVSPVTGLPIPDENAQVPKEKYINPRKAEWPQADFIVGNPPFIGNKMMRAALGDGYTEALRGSYREVPDTADLVMYWWDRAAHAIGPKCAHRAGFIATNSITQVFNRQILQQRLAAEPAKSIAFAIPDHPWVDSGSAADVRIAMVVLGPGRSPGVLQKVSSEIPGPDGAAIILVTLVGLIHADLTVGAPVLDAVPLRANASICQQGVKLVGPRGQDSFVIQRSELAKFGGAGGVIKPYVSNREVVQRWLDRHVVDFFGMTEDEALQANPAAYQRLRDHVQPFRVLNRDRQRRRNWWLFGRSNAAMRDSVAGLSRFIITPEVAKHRPFVFVHGTTVPDASLYIVGSDSALVLGVLSSRIHMGWALAAGGHLGVGNDPRYQNGSCFLPFPFPTCMDAQAQHIGDLAEQLDAHRKRQQAKHPDLTITGMYNVLEKLRSGEPLTDKDKVIHEKGLVSVLRKIHDDLDAAVFDAYGWPHDLSDEEILEKLVALNAERAAEERNGLVRWLRPEFQNPGGTKAMAQVAMEGSDEETEAETAAPVAKTSWPKKLPDQIAAVRDLVTKTSDEWSVKDVSLAFKGAVKNDVETLLDGLTALGLLVSYELATGRRWRASKFVG